jgi:hypothetical protein
VNFDVIDQLLFRDWRKMGVGCKEIEPQLCIDFKKVYALFRRQILYSILIKCSIFTELFELNKCT